MEKTKKHVNQFIVCDDGGSDNTVAIAESYKAIVIPRETNEGYGAALKSLFNTDLKIKPDIILTLDSDGQHNPDDIPRLVSHLMENKNDLSLVHVLSRKNPISLNGKAGIEIINKISANGSD